MKKYISLFIVFVLAFWHVWGAIYYDADTNSYITTDSETSSDEWTGSQSQDDNAWDTDEEINEDQDEETEEDVDTDTSDEDESVVEDISHDGPLNDLHEDLDEHADELRSKLKWYYDSLRNKVNDVEMISGWVARIDVLQCLWLIDEDLDLRWELNDVYNQLHNQIGIVEADIHSDISALEEKIDNDLLDGLAERLEISAATNKVLSYFNEYDNVVDTFQVLFEEYISDADTLVEDASEENISLLWWYDHRIEEYEALESDYDNFVKKSSFAGVVAGPNIQELYELKDNMRWYYSSKLRSQWYDDAVVYVPRYAAERAKLLDITEALDLEFERQFDDYASELLEWLYPVEDLLLLHKSILSLRGAYTDSDGHYDCKAFATNKTIESSWPQLREYMKTVLSNLNKYATEVADEWLPQDAEALRQGMAKWLAKKSSTMINNIVKVHKDKLKQRFQDSWLTILGVPNETQRDKNEQFTRFKLQKAYLKFFGDGKIKDFHDGLDAANEKLEKALLKDISAGAKQTLQMIQSVIMEFL